MAVQVPELKRTAPQEPASVGRLDVNVSDTSKIIANQTQAVSHVGEALVKYQDAAQDYAADTAKMRAQNEVDVWAHNKLFGAGGLAYQDGDPGPIYDQFDKQLKEQMDAKVNDSNLPSYTRDAIQQGLGQTYAKIQDRKTSAYGKQYNDYTEKTANSSVDISANDTVIEAGKVMKDDPNSLVGVRRTLDEIYNTRVKTALKLGSAREKIDPETGKVVGYDINPSVQRQIAKDTSKALYESIRNLNNSDRPEEAAYLQNQFKDQIDGFTIEKLSEHTKATAKNVEALKAYDKVFNLPPEKAYPILDKMPPDVRVKAAEFYHSYRNKQELDLKNSQDKNLDFALNIAIKGNFPDSTTALQDPGVKRVYDKMSAKGKITFTHFIDKPKEDNKDALFRAQNLFAGNDPQGRDIRDMSVSEVGQELTGLSKATYNKYMKKKENLSSPSGAQEHALYQRMHEKLFSELERTGLVSPKKFYGTDPKQQDLYLNAVKELDATLSKSGQLSEGEQTDWVSKLVKRVIIDKGSFNPQETLRFNKSAGTVTKKKYEDLNNNERMQGVKAWQKATNAGPTDVPTNAVLKKFMGY